MLEFSWDVIDPFLIRLAFAYSAFLLLKPHLGFKPMAIIFALVALLGEFDPIYQAFLEFWPERNPQISTAIYAGILVPLTIGQVFIKRRRTADRVLMAMSLSAIMVTTYLFHSQLITGSMYAWANQVNQESRVMLMLQKEALAKACDAQDLVCSVNGDIDAMPISEKIREGAKRIERETREAAQQRYISHSYVELNDIRSKDIAFMTFYADTNGPKVIAASAQAEWAHRSIKQAFYFLGTVAHATWLTLACGLMLLHGRLLRRRARQ